MKEFDYTVRDKSGSLVNGTIRASDRLSAITALKGKGQIPVEVKESSGGGTAILTPSALFRKKVIIAVGVVFGVILLWQIIDFKSLASTMKVGRVPQKHDKTKSIEKRSVVGGEKIINESTNKVALTSVRATVPGEDRGKTLGVTNAPPRRPGVHVLTKDGQEVFHPRHELKTQTDRFLWAVVNSKGTKYIPVSVMHVEKDFEKALSEKIEILPTDTPDDVANKEKVEQVKSQINDMLKRGYKLSDIIRAIQNDQNAATEIRREVRKELFSLIREGKLDDAEKLNKAANDEFGVEKIEPVYAPPELLQIGLEKANEANATK